MKNITQYSLFGLNLLTCLIMAVIMVLSLQSNAQTDNRNRLMQMIEDDPTTIDAIAGYDEKLQSHILIVSQTPEVFGKIEELQKKSQNKFRSIIQNFDRDTQSAFYELARYPNLVNDLVNQSRPSPSEVNRIVSKYPEDIHEITMNYALRYFEVLVRIDRLNAETDNAFQFFLKPYNQKTRESVYELLAYPEIVSVLVQDRVFTTLLGVIYSEDSDWIVRRLYQISQQLAEQSKTDLETYKNQIQSDPQAYNEMLEASERFAAENNQSRYSERLSNPIIELKVINNYPYWFGYPYWYSSPYWRPLPYYYHTGFYRNHFGNVVFLGLPSNHFMHWKSFFHPTLFPHLSYNYYSYYQKHYFDRNNDKHRPVSSHGFYKSIEANVINNPHVNNSTLEKIDHQRGNNIVHQPNTTVSGSINRGSSYSPRQNEAARSIVKPIQSESSVNRRGTVPNREVTKSGTLGTSTPNVLSTKPAPKRTSSNNAVNRPAESQKSITRQVSSKPTSVQTEKSVSKTESTSAPIRKKIQATTTQSPSRYVKREIKQPTQAPAVTRSVSESGSSARSKTSESPQTQKELGRRR